MVQIRVGSGDKADVKGPFPDCPDRQVTLLLQGAKQFHLIYGSKVTDFIKEQRTTFGSLEKSRLVTVRTGERPFAVPEKFGSDKVIGNGTAVHGYKRLVPAQASLMNLGGNMFLYCQADPVLCKRLEEAGAATVMPLGAPIGTNKGLQTKEFLQIIIEQAGIPVVVDAGIGAPSHAAEAMELGASAVLVNTAIAVAGNPVEMAKAFKAATEAGRQAYEAGLGLQAVDFVAEASSPLTAFLD